LAGTNQRRIKLSSYGGVGMSSVRLNFRRHGAGTAGVGIVAVVTTATAQFSQNLLRAKQEHQPGQQQI
jgi:hypothetical protein